MDENIIEMKNITMRFGPILANDRININIKEGTIHSLIGENGAGKSTLMSILFGIYSPSMGTIKINQKETIIRNPNHATKLGLGMVHQHFKLVGIYNAVENIILGKEETKNGFIQFSKSRKKIEELAKKYNLDIDFNIKVKDMSVGMQQRVEILKMLYTDSKVLIFDEPTAVLTPKEIDGFLKMLIDFKKSGKTIILITHKLDEIKKVADTGTIIRRGKVVGNVLIKKTSKKEISNLMVGKKIVESRNNYKKNNDKEKVILNIKDLSVNKKKSKKKALDNISLSINKGEIVAIAGVEGNGQSELAKVISGLSKADQGHIYLNDLDITKDSIKIRYSKGLSFIPEDRHKHGLVLDMTIGENISNKLFYKRPYSKFGILNYKQCEIISSKVISTFDVRGSNKGSNIARHLSGGNQQKAIVGRELETNHKLLLAVQPTRGLDVGAIEYIHSRILQDKEAGNAILLISYELDEILSLADKIIVLNDGRVTGKIDGKDASKEKLGHFMTMKGGS